MIERYVTLACVSNEVGGDLIGNARWLGVPIAGPARGGRPGGRRRPGGRPLGGRLHRRHADRGAAATAGTRCSPIGDERRAAADRARVPGPDGGARPVRLRLGHQVARRAGADHVRRLRRVLGPARLGAAGPDQDRSRGSTAPGRRHGAGRRGRGGRRRLGPAPGHLARSRCGSTAVPWQTATLAAVASVDTWRLWSWRWNATPGEHTLEVRATDNAGETQTEPRLRRRPDGADRVAHDRRRRVAADARTERATGDGSQCS